MHNQHTKDLVVMAACANLNTILRVGQVNHPLTAAKEAMEAVKVDMEEVKVAMEVVKEAIVATATIGSETKKLLYRLEAMTKADMPIPVAMEISKDTAAIRSVVAAVVDET